MQKWLTLFVVISGIGLFANAEWASEHNNSGAATRHAIAAYVADDQLKLSAEQQQRLATVVNDELEDIRKVSDDSLLSADEKLQKTKALQQQARIDGANILTLEQQKLLGTLKEKHLADIRAQLEKSPADVFILQVITEDDDKVFPWLTQGQLKKIAIVSLGLQQRDAVLQLSCTVGASAWGTKHLRQRASYMPSPPTATRSSDSNVRCV